MGTQGRDFVSHPAISLEDSRSQRFRLPALVNNAGPQLRAGTRGDRYAPGGRPSIDPEVFFELQLIMFFEDLRSERQLMQVVADRLSLR